MLFLLSPSLVISVGHTHIKYYVVELPVTSSIFYTSSLLTIDQQVFMRFLRNILGSESSYVDTPSTASFFTILSNSTKAVESEQSDLGDKHYGLRPREPGVNTSALHHEE